MKSVKNLVPSSMLSFLRKILLGKGAEAPYTRPFYSQVGEDIILAQLRGIMSIPQKGFFIDVGSFHPFDKSNTFMLYKAGWTGINIDPNPRCKPLFDKFRPLDITLGIGISRQKSKLAYYVLDDLSGMNTFSKEALEKIGMIDSVKKILEIETLPLSQVIDEYVPQNVEIDFLNIDAEGYEMEVLESINWNYKQPQIIALEQNNVLDMNDVLASKAAIFLLSHNYVPVAKCMVTEAISTVFYIKRSV